MTVANTNSLSTDFNVSPYFDDYSEDKNFHRVLFKPGLAVQARELTQLQTILQNQVDRFGEHIFTEGSTVRGLEMTYDQNMKYVKLRDNDSTGASVNAAAFVGTTLTGGTSGVTAFVLDSLTGSEAGTPNTKTLYIKYTGSGSLGTAAAFLSGEQLTSNTAISANVCTEGAQSSQVVGTGSRIKFGDGIIYAKDHFIRVASSNTVVGRYSSNTNLKIGYDITESVVSSSVDTTLLDPAQGSYNYAAPGADRLKLNATITTKALTDTNVSNFVERIRLKNGNPEFKGDKPNYSIIDQYIARRTYDESGNYIVKGLNTRLREHLNSANNGGVFLSGAGGDVNKLSVDVAPGKAYVKGFEVENLLTNHVAIDKGIDVNNVENISVPANYGNYSVVDEVVGTWDIDGHDRVDLYDTAMNAISNTTFSSVGPVGNKIGEARVRALQYASGTKGAAAGQYNLYLYDINMTANNFTTVRSVYFNDSTHDGFADTVLTSSKAKLNDTEFNRALFTIPAGNIKRLRDASGNLDNEFNFLKSFPVTIATNGTVTITTGDATEQFPFSTGALNSTQERDNFHVVLKASGNTASTLETTAARAQSANTVTGVTSATSKYNVGDIIKLQGEANTYVVSEVTSDTQLKVHGNGEGNAITGATLFKNFVAGQVISLNGVGGDAAARSATVNSTTSTTLDIQETVASTIAAEVVCELKKVNGQQIAKGLQTDRYVEINVSDSGTTVGPWNLGVSDGFALKEVRLKTGNAFFTTTAEGTAVTDSFELDSGMRDNVYDHAKLKLKNGASHTPAAGSVYLAKLDFFTHDTSQGVGYLSVESYPVDDANTANTIAITTGEIPVYTSTTTNKRHDLRDHIDIRPRIIDTANNVTSLTNISRNPATSTTIVEPTGGLRFMAPNENFTTDFEYYLPRKDRIVITEQGAFRVIKGVSELHPKTPPSPADGMTIAIVEVKPFPSLPQESAKRIRTATAPGGRNELSIKIEPVRIRRYTMKDINGLEQRIDNLEYYTSLSLLESDTKNLFLADSTGDDRFKNGMIVDQFVDFTASDFYDDGYAVALHKQTKEARPTYKVDDVQMAFNSANSSNVSATSKDTTITLSSTSAVYTVGETVTQGSASATMSSQAGTKLYLENTSGTFDTSANVVGGSSSSTSAVSAVTTPNAGKLILLPWTHEETISQPFATDTRNVAGLNYNFRGVITLTPDTDYWNDTTEVPSVNIDFGHLSDALAEIGNHVGVQWEGWGNGQVIANQHVGFGGQDGNQRLMQQTVEETRTGTELVVETGELIETNLGDSVQNVNLIPFMRSRVVNFTAQGMKPNTRLYAFFDNTDVNAFVAQANSSFANTNAEGTSLISDSTGLLYGNFRIPNDDNIRFPVGNLKFKLTDSPTNSEALGSSATTAEANYSAGGLDVTTQGTIISTREVEVTTREVIDVRNVNRTIVQRSVDPLAQTFRVSDGIDSNVPGAFLSKMELFFASKDANQPIIFEIRETDPSTSYVTPKVVPFSRVTIPAADVNVSANSSVATPIVFETPIYLMNNIDYALLIMPADGNPNVTVWTARLGQNDLVTGNRITKQPSSGVLFASSNDRSYTAFQEEDLKYKLYFADFGTNKSGTAVFKNTDKEYFSIDTLDSTAIFNRIGESVHGETALTLSGAPGGITIGDTLVGGTSSANGTVTNVAGSVIRLKEVTTGAKFTNTETVTLFKAGIAGGNTATVTSQTTPTGKVYFFDNVTQSNTMVHLSEPSGSFAANTFLRGQISGLDGRIATMDNLKLDVFQTFASKLDLQDTTTSMTAKLALTETGLDTAFRKININSDTFYDARRFVLGKSNEIANLSSAKSAEVIATLTNGANKRHSPAIDNDRAAIFTVENLVNNDSTSEDSTGNGNALARYVQRTVTLAEGQDAEDLKVFLSAYKPSTATIKVYVKILNGEDGSTMDDKTYIELSQITSTTVVSDSENTEDFREYEYNIPTASLTGAGGEVQYTDGGVTYTGFKYFKIKVVLLSTTPSRVPRIKDFRAIALQI